MEIRVDIETARIELYLAKVLWNSPVNCGVDHEHSQRSGEREILLTILMRDGTRPMSATSHEVVCLRVISFTGSICVKPIIHFPACGRSCLLLRFRCLFDRLVELKLTILKLSALRSGTIADRTQSNLDPTSIAGCLAPSVPLRLLARTMLWSPRCGQQDRRNGHIDATLAPDIYSALSGNHH